MLKLISYYDGKDRWYLEAIGTAAERKEEQLYQDIQKAESAIEWDDRLANIIWRLHPAIAVSGFRERANSQKLTEKQRKQAIDALAFIKSDAAAQALLEVHGRCKGTLQAYCLWWLNMRNRNYWKSYLAGVDLKQLNQAQLAFDNLKKEFINAPSPALLKRLLATPKGTRVLLQLAINNGLPRSIKETTTQALLNHQNNEISGLAKTYLTAKKSAYDVAAILKIKGDPVRGKVLFGGRAICFSCHNVSGKGGDLGPELTAIKTKFDREALLDAIINPSSGILVGYESVNILLKDGNKINGTLLSNKDPIVVRNSLGQKVEIALSKIKSQEISKTSIMPDASSIGLNQQELADILSYLNNIKNN